MITEAIVEEIKGRIDLVDLVESYGIAVKTAGASKKACCPFHHEKTPSFHINENRGFYHCFGCGESGDAIKFVMKMEGLTFTEAVKKLAARVGVKIEEKEDHETGKRKRIYTLMSELAQFYHRCLKQMKAAEIAREYLKRRDLNEQVVDDWLIGYAPSGIAPIERWATKYGYTMEDLEAAGIIKSPDRPDDKAYHRFGGRLMFTIRDKQGRVVAFSGRQLVESKNSGKYVNSPETMIFKKSKVLFGFDKAAKVIASSPHHEVIVCEGQIDTIRLHISGFPIAVASQGTAFTEAHVKMLKRVSDQVTLVFDDDTAGHKATIRTAGLFLAAGMPVRVVSLPNGEDPDSFLRKHPAEEFSKMLDGAESIMSFQTRIERAKETNPDSIDAVSRITKAVLVTISQSTNAVLRASMIGEAAKFLKLPAVALNDELTKVKSVFRKKVDVVTEDEGLDEDVIESVDGGEETPITAITAEEYVPPPKIETSFCQLLMANEYTKEAKTMDSLIGELLPAETFESELTRRFVEVWRTEIAQGEDLVAPWREALSDYGKKWFDEVLIGQVETEKNQEGPLKQIEECIRKLWCARVRRILGELPASDEDFVNVRKKMGLKTKEYQITHLKWSKVKDIIRDLMKGSE